MIDKGLNNTASPLQQFVCRGFCFLGEILFSLGKKIFLIQNIVLLGIAVKIFGYTAYPPFWDACSFILIGKYIFSNGGVGLLEPFRPLGWSVFLGLFWKLGADPILAGRILEMAAGVGNIFLVYLVGEKIYGRYQGLLAALFLALSPTFFIWGNSLCTDVWASFLGLLAFVFYLKGIFFVAGVFGGLAAFTRFPHILLVIGLIGLVSTEDKARRTFAGLSFVGGFCLITALFLMLHQKFYNDIFFPFKQGAIGYPYFLTDYSKGMLRCLRLLIEEENFFLVLIPLSLFKILSRRLDRFQWAVLWTAGVSLAWTGKFAVDHHRLSIAALPYLFLLSADCLIQFASYLERKKYFKGKIFFLGIIFVYLIFQFIKIEHMHFPKNQLSPLQKYIQQHKSQIKGTLWISNPNQLIFTSLKATQLMYDPIFNIIQAQKLKFSLSRADVIILDSRDLLCRRPDDIERCLEAKKNLLQDIKEKFFQEFISESSDSLITIGVFRRR